MNKSTLRLNVLLFVAILFLPAFVQAQRSDYRTPDQVLSWIRQTETGHPGVASASQLTTTPGGSPLYLIRIGKNLEADQAAAPSVFVGANLEGTRPLATEGAIFLAETILADPANYDSLNWYILPLGNPDAAERFFKSPLMEDSRNNFPTNDDLDEQTDEDGANDLNKDGYITDMRLIHPEGEWLISDKDPRLMKKADPAKGEQGIYKIYTEGTDDDGDGKYNEDGPGGTNVEINFPQLFKHYTSDGGKFPGSTPESYAIMKFVFEHPEIAMIVSFGSTNWCHTPPKGGRKGEADLTKIRLNEGQARQFNVDAGRTYTLQELLGKIKAENPQSNIEESTLLGYLDISAALNPQPGDLVFYEKYAKEYQAYLKDMGIEEKRIEPDAARDGSFELWGYFQVGVPVFSMDLWSLPRQDSSNVEEILLALSDSTPARPAFVEWESFEHPTLGSVEIGGFIPYAGTTPPYEWTDSLLSQQIPWILKLAGELPDLNIYEVKSTALGKGIYQLDIWIENRAFIPFPTDMGNRNGQPAPAVLTLEGEQLKFVSGYRRTPIRRVPGKSRIKTTLILQMENPGEIILKLESKTAGNDVQSIKIGG